MSAFILARVSRKERGQVTRLECKILATEWQKREREARLGDECMSTLNRTLLCISAQV